MSAFRRPVRAFDELGEPEVENLHRAIGPHLDVRRLEIAMDDALFVRGLERFRNLPRDRQRLVDGNRTFRKAICERGTVDEFEHERWYVGGRLQAALARTRRCLRCSDD